MVELVRQGNHTQLQHDGKITTLHDNRGKDLPMYDGLIVVDEFLNKFERDVQGQ